MVMVLLEECWFKAINKAHEVNAFQPSALHVCTPVSAQFLKEIPKRNCS